MLDGSNEEDRPFEWRRFPVGHARIRANRWLDRRRAALFVFWYVFVLLPGLALVYSTVLVDPILGFALLAVVPPLGAFLTLLIMGVTGGRRVTFNQATALDGHHLYTKYGPKPPTATDLHAGVTSVLRPDWRHGRASVLAVDTGSRRKAVLYAGDLTVTKGEESPEAAITDWSTGVLMCTGVVLLIYLAFYFLTRLVHFVWTAVDALRRTLVTHPEQEAGHPCAPDQQVVGGKGQPQ